MGGWTGWTGSLGLIDAEVRGITDSMYASLTELRELVMDREA